MSNIFSAFVDVFTNKSDGSLLVKIPAKAEIPWIKINITQYFSQLPARHLYFSITITDG